MGVLKVIGQVGGGIVGGVVGGAVSVVGEAVNSKMLREIGEGVFKSSMKAGETVGSFADGAVAAAAGTAFSDPGLQRQGLKEMEGAVVETAVGVGKSVVHVVKSGKMVVDGVIAQDTEKALKGGGELVKVAAIATLAIGVLDIVDLPGEADVDDAGEVNVSEAASPADVPDDHVLAENPNTHFVQAHSRTLPSGETIWVDGDGDTSVNTQGGWVQSNPDYRVKS